MTGFQSSGLVIQSITYRQTFLADYSKLTPNIKNRVDKQIEKCMQNPMPRGLRFEKLQGHSNPDIYTIHVTGNWKISMEINGSTADLRRIAVHNTIDRNP